ncbi:hypothetical protein COV05_01935 [Candidatus Uhrbacteria bacterium CG10_big_fil_rev_8_21_14_0_10_48_16]|uniref:LemA family protein n=1 Tax=Candidatus Uhrbacteria bacterium CG10_big_fil_rev_8_21_14_0_10_48_16 TaxID=1975038 RepID=A0A2M8LHL6_9BACT|nr:MAG: hypothetical protein COV05_01935 [Candidatus Uhrbacteria bacterium CG10_big_fil_rev_8_21_14_0_10_48_16]
MQNKGLLVGLLSLAVIAMMTIGMYVNYTNAEVRTRNLAEAQQENLEVVFDATWKIIQQKAGVSSQYAKDFKEIYPELMEGRYGNDRGGALMSWITEHNPEFDTALYQDLMRSIEAERTKFAREQKKLIDIKAQHDNLRETLPSSIFVGGRPEIKIQLVTSAKTDEAFSSGQENDVDLFSNGKN